MLKTLSMLIVMREWNGDNARGCERTNNGLRSLLALLSLLLVVGGLVSLALLVLVVALALHVVLPVGICRCTAHARRSTHAHTTSTHSRQWSADKQSVMGCSADTVVVRPCVVRCAAALH